MNSELKYVAESSSLSHTEKSQKLIELVDRASKELGQPAPKWLDVGGASDGNRFSGGSAAVACGMGVVGGDLHNPEKEWSDLSTVKPRIELGRKVLELIAKKRPNKRIVMRVLLRTRKSIKKEPVISKTLVLIDSPALMIRLRE